ncbi:MAG: sodium:calcium antiporter [Arhodomonas sp.]|nr:sodium:calcium antiporter [Arhodomonas sp.]
MSALDPAAWGLYQAVIVFVVCVLAIALAGTRITRIVDQLADRTGIGEAAAGAVPPGASTSLGGVVLSVTAAWKGHPELAVSNAVGGIAVQTFFLAVADLTYRRANLEHAAASVPNLMQAALLLSLLSLILLTPSLPDVTLLGIHPVTPVLLVFYGYGIRLVRGAQEAPMWRPFMTRETREDRPDDTRRMPPLPRLWAEFAGLMVVMGVAGLLLEPAAVALAARTGLSHTLVGVLLTAVGTSIPELVTSVAAVRRGALTLAVGGIIGGNAFDTLFVAASDVGYRPGSVYHAMSADSRFWITLTLLMSCILIMGLIRRERYGIARIGMESAAILVLYGMGVVILVKGGVGS